MTRVLRPLAQWTVEPGLVKSVSEDEGVIEMSCSFVCFFVWSRHKTTGVGVFVAVVVFVVAVVAVAVAFVNAVVVFVVFVVAVVAVAVAVVVAVVLAVVAVVVVAVVAALLPPRPCPCPAR